MSGCRKTRRIGSPTIAPSLKSVAGVQPGVVLVLEEVRDEQRRRDLGELRRLELELADADPGPHVGDALAEEEQVDERQEASRSRWRRRTSGASGSRRGSPRSSRPSPTAIRIACRPARPSNCVPVVAEAMKSTPSAASASGAARAPRGRCRREPGSDPRDHGVSRRAGRRDARGAADAAAARQRRGRRRRAPIPKRASKSALASGAAARLPWPPFSTKTTTTICGSFDRAESREPGVILEPRLGPRRPGSSISRPTTCTVPVLPPISTPRDPRAVGRAARLVHDRPHAVLDDRELLRRQVAIASRNSAL